MGVRNQLFSFFYWRTALHSSGHKALALMARMRRARDKGYRFALDSGAFTYQVKARSMVMPPPQRYFDEYCRFVLQHGSLFDIIAEYDVDKTVVVDERGNHVPYDPKSGAPLPDGTRFITTNEVDEWTNALLDEKDVRSKIMPVYHPDRGKEWLQSWLIDTRSPLVGFSSDNLSGAAGTIALCHRYGKWIHGFGQTRIQTDAKYLAFDSVDSTTWLRADKYGGTMIFKNDKLVVLDHLHKAQRRLYRNWYESWGLDFAKIMADDLNENRLATITTWRELCNAFERKAVLRSNGHYPYLWEMHRDGRVPEEHPMVTKWKAEHANSGGQ